MSTMDHWLTLLAFFKCFPFKYSSHSNHVCRNWSSGKNESWSNEQESRQSLINRKTCCQMEINIRSTELPPDSREMHWVSPDKKKNQSTAHHPHIVYYSTSNSFGSPTPVHSRDSKIRQSCDKRVWLVYICQHLVGLIVCSLSTFSRLL